MIFSMHKGTVTLARKENHLSFIADKKTGYDKMLSTFRCIIISSYCGTTVILKHYVNSWDFTYSLTLKINLLFYQRSVWMTPSAFLNSKWYHRLTYCLLTSELMWNSSGQSEDKETWLFDKKLQKITSPIVNTDKNSNWKEVYSYLNHDTPQ